MIEDPVQKLGTRLLSCELTDAELAERYRKEISAMLFRGPGIRPRTQIVCGLVLILIALASAIIAWFAEQATLRLMIVPGAVFMCFLGATAVVFAIRGVDVRRYRRLWYGASMLFLVLLAEGLVLGSWYVEDARLRWQLAAAAFVILGLLGVGVVEEKIENSHRRIELRLLDLEYRLADLAEKNHRS